MSAYNIQGIMRMSGPMFGYLMDSKLLQQLLKRATLAAGCIWLNQKEIH